MTTYSGDKAPRAASAAAVAPAAVLFALSQGARAHALPEPPIEDRLNTFQLSGFLALDTGLPGNIGLGETSSHPATADLDTRRRNAGWTSIDVDMPCIYRSACVFPTPSDVPTI